MGMKFNTQAGSKKEHGYPCDICGSTSTQVIWDKSLREELGVLGSVVIRDEENKIIHGRIVMCEKCGLIYTDPKLSELDLIEFYKKDYRKTYSSSPDHQLQMEANHSNTAFQILQRYINVEKLKAENGVVNYADIGASTLRACTGFKKTFNDNARVFAVEPSKEYIQMGLQVNKKYDMECQIEIYNGMVEHFKPNCKIDFATMLNTLEHMHSPSKTLQAIHGIMDDGGILVVSVPTILNISAIMAVDAWFSNAHLYHFAPPTINMLLLKNGFKPLEMVGTTEEVGEKMYVVAEKCEPQEIEFDKKPDFGLMRKYLLEQDAVNMSRISLAQGGYYK